MPLDERTWLILPFENTARNADAELIRAAGLNLLYQELSRWDDVRIISDDRVDDLLRELPEAQRTSIGLESARSLARRVGAGRVVLGDYLAVGARAQIAAKVYDAATGRQLRLVRERLVGYSGNDALDSMSATYSRLGAAIIGLPPRQGGASIVPTASLDAYREYLAGMAAGNRIEVAAAQTHLRRALAADSTFALAWLGLAQFSTDQAEATRALASAERFLSRLPPREAARLAAIRGTSGPAANACGPAARLLAIDSSEVDGWRALARCEARQRPLQQLADGSWTYGGNRHRSLEAIRRALSIDPADLFANAEQWNALLTTRTGLICIREGPGGPCPQDSLLIGALQPSGDSVLMVLEPWTAARANSPYLRPEAVTLRRARLAEVVSSAEAWLAASPGNMGARVLRAFAQGELGNLGAAASAVDSLPTSFGRILLVGHAFRLQLSLARELADIASRVDSVHQSQESTRTQGQLYGMLGRYREDALRNPDQRAAREGWTQVVAGVLPPGLDSIERVLAATFNTEIERQFVFEASTVYAFNMRRAGPALDTAAAHPIRRFQAWFARGDTTRARAALREFDGILSRRLIGTPDDGGWYFAAESWLLLGDSARARSHMADWGRRWSSPVKEFNERVLDLQAYFSMPRLYGRMWLLYADLASTPAEQRRGYRMVVNLWQNGDPPVQPLVARARTALAQLGS